jgi:hypothetical protein
MRIYIYLDQNIISDVRDGKSRLKSSDVAVWVYSNETLAEINRSDHPNQYLQLLDALKAVKIELILDSNFKITGQASFLEHVSARDAYTAYVNSSSEVPYDYSSDIELIARIFGADNKNSVLSYPDIFESNIRALIEPHGLYSPEIKLVVENIRDTLSEFVAGSLQEIGNIEVTRQALGTHRARADNLKHKDNPIESLWEIIKPAFPEMTADQCFGFNPVDNQGYEEWPMFLGIIACHTMLNTLGFRPDDGLSKPEGIPNILSDGIHIAYGAYCHGLMSRDQKLLAKARSIYRYKNIATQLITTRNQQSQP